MKSPNDSSDPAKSLLQGQLGFALALGLALDLAVSIAVGFWADGRFGTRPWCTLLGVLIGLTTAGATVYGITRAANRRSDGQPPA